jgi:NAD(P)-dependent dehydrogenase (short-subunit alcohol dehydrogenase family)
MDLGLTDRVAIVTGSSRGIGRACAESLLAEGATVVVSGRDQKRLDAAAKELGQRGKVLAVRADLERDADARALISRAVDAFGRLDILVNSAASVIPSDFFAIGEERWTRVFEEKLNGYARALRHAVPVMRERKWGRIINVSGVAARQPHAPTITVGLNNAAVLNLTKALAAQLAKESITINAVIPHIIDTDRQAETMTEWAKITGQSEEEVRKERVSKIPLGRMGRPREVGDAVAFLASERASFITGTALHVDGGVTMSI